MRRPGWLSRYSDSLRAGRSGDRIPVWGNIFRNSPERLWAHPASYAVGAGSFLMVNRPGRGVDHTPPSIADVKEGVEPYLHSPYGPSWPVLG